jgi:hypothetical protein
MLFATEKVWHYWIAVPLALMAILAVVAIVALYAAKVTRTRYPKSES